MGHKLKPQNNKYKYDFTLADNTVLHYCQDFDLDLRFVYYFNKYHYLIDRKTGRLFIQTENYPQLRNLYLTKLNNYEKFITKPEYLQLILGK